MSAPDRVWRSSPWSDAGYDAGLASWPQKENASHDATEYVRADLAPQWQDIATAPEDGAIMVYFGKLNNALSRLGIEYGESRLYAESISAAYCIGGNVYERNTGHDLTDHMDADEWPTHWMPLPTPPETKP